MRYFFSSFLCEIFCLVLYEALLVGYLYIYSNFQSLLYEIINGLRAAGTDAGSSSAATTNFTNATKSVVELLTERVNQLSVKNDNDLDFLLDENHNLTQMDSNTTECHLEDKANRQTEECCSYTSSNRESWGRCSSLGAACDGSSSGEQPGIPNHKHKSMTLRALATPLRRIRRKPLTIPKEKKNRSLWKRLKKERQEMGENLSQRLRLCLQGQARHKRTKSS